LISESGMESSYGTDEQTRTRPLRGWPGGQYSYMGAGSAAGTRQFSHSDVRPASASRALTQTALMGQIFRRNRTGGAAHVCFVANRALISSFEEASWAVLALSELFDEENGYANLFRKIRNCGKTFASIKRILI
jgi:hypothetical protein